VITWTINRIFVFWWCSYRPKRWSHYHQLNSSRPTVGNILLLLFVSSFLQNFLHCTTAWKPWDQLWLWHLFIRSLATCQLLSPGALHWPGWQCMLHNSNCALWPRCTKGVVEICQNWSKLTKTLGPKPICLEREIVDILQPFHTPVLARCHILIPKNWQPRRRHPISCSWKPQLLMKTLCTCQEWSM